MASKPVYLTKSGVQKLEEKLKYLTSERRKEVADRIKAAIALGDLSENSEYDDAKNDQAFLEGEIRSIESALRHAEIIDESNIDGSSVSLGAVVKVKDMDRKREMEYTIVGSDEADPFNGSISNESPIGSALIGRKLDEEVTIDTPRGNKKLKIVAIHR